MCLLSIYFTFKLHGFLFLAIQLEIKALSYPFMINFYALLEVFFWDVPPLCRYGPLEGLCTFKTAPLDDPHDDPFELRKK